MCSAPLEARAIRRNVPVRLTSALPIAHLPLSHLLSQPTSLELVYINPELPQLSLPLILRCSRSAQLALSHVLYAASPPPPLQLHPTMPFLELPPELIFEITNFLPESSVLSLLVCSRKLRDLLLPQLYILDLQRTAGTRQLFHYIRHRYPIEDVIKLCETNKISVHATSAFTDTSALHVAVYYQRNEIVKWLLEVKKMDPNCRDDFGFTPLHVASVEGYIRGLDWLLVAGADVEAVGGGTVSAKALKWRDLSWVKGPGRPIYSDPEWPEFV